MRWRKLSSWPDEQLWRGTVLRMLKSQYPYEVPVDVMLVQSHSSSSGFSLIVTSGYHAGSILRELPASALAGGQTRAISRTRLQEYWQSEIYEACPVTAVRIVAGYPPGVGTPCA
jgi:hypothetical protein